MNIKNLTNGILKENPTFVQLLGMCPTLAVTTSAINGFGMGIATTSVLIMSNVVISLLRKVIPEKIRIPSFIVVIATAVTIVGMLMEAYVPPLYESLGLFIPLIVVNCIILARAEAFAFTNNVLDSAFDGIGMGLGFTLSLTILGTVRELLGGFSLFGNHVFSFFMSGDQLAQSVQTAEPMLMMIQPPGAFLTLAILLAMYNQVGISKKKKQRAIEMAEKKARLEEEAREAERIEKEKEEKRKAREAKKAAEKAAKEAAEKAAKEAEEKAVSEEPKPKVSEEPATKAEEEPTPETEAEAPVEEKAEKQGEAEVKEETPASPKEENLEKGV